MINKIRDGDGDRTVTCLHIFILIVFLTAPVEVGAVGDCPKCCNVRASNEGSRRFHNHREGPYTMDFYGLDASTSAFTFKTLY